MEAIKNAIGLGSAPQEGREPVSGVVGSGTAGEPYDQGNADDPALGGKAPQYIDPATDYSTNPSPSTAASTGPYTIGSGLGSNNTTTSMPTDTKTGLSSSDAVTPNAASATSPSGPAVDPTSSNTTSGPHDSNIANKADPRVDSDNDRTAGINSSNTTSTYDSTNSGPHSSNVANKADPRVDSDNDKTTASGVGSTGAGSTGGIGSSSWMSTALPHRETKNEKSSEPSTSGVSGTTAQQPSQSHSEQSPAPPTGLEDITSRPPNNLPTNVPTGISTDFVAPGSTPSDVTGTTSAATSSSIPSSTTATNTDPMHAHQDILDEPVGGGVQSAHAPSHSLQGSRGSIAVTKPDHTNAPLKPAEKGGEHGINPSAIPTAGGKKIGEDAYTERKSVQADSLDSGLPATTSTNTARNVGTAEAAGSPTTVGHEKETSSVTSGGSGSEHKEKKGLGEKIKEKLHVHKH